MKLNYTFFIFFILIFFISCTSTRNNTQENYSQDYSSQPSVITYQQFYDDLSPYGYWVNYPGYGYSWIPNDRGFRPYYSNGHWVYTTYGWTWFSNYNWGWAPFHYGRWINDSFYGWVWVPGYEWAPAWVAWRGSGNYYGWAPLQPGMNRNLSRESIPDNYWTFIPNRYINSPQINNYYINQSRNITIINNTTVINNNERFINHTSQEPQPAYNAGPSVADVERSTRMKIRQFNIVDSDKPSTTQINNNSIRLYRPNINEQHANSGNVKPARLKKLQELPANPMVNNPNRDHTDNGDHLPEKRFPDHSPNLQLNRNDIPANKMTNGNPAMETKKNNEPARLILPNNNQPQGLSRNEYNINHTSPVTIPKQENQFNALPPQYNRNMPSNPQERKFKITETPQPGNNGNTIPAIRNTNNFQRNENNPLQQNQPMAKQKIEFTRESPVLPAREFPQAKREKNKKDN